MRSNYFCFTDNDQVGRFWSPSKNKKASQVEQEYNKHKQTKDRQQKHLIMAILTVGAAATALLATNFFPLAGAQLSTVSSSPIVDGSDATVKPVAYDVSTSSNALLVSYSSEAASKAIKATIDKQKKQGIDVSIKSDNKFMKPQKSTGAMTKTNNGKGNNRYLQSSDPISNVGYAVIKTSPELMNSQIDLLFGITGVTSVERDVEQSIMDVPSLRGRSAHDQIKDIMDAVAAMDQVSTMPFFLV